MSSNSDHDLLTIHQSQLSMFYRCGMQYKFRYIDGLICPPSAALTVGTAVHAGINADYSHKIATGENLAIEHKIDACVTEFNRLEKDTDWKEDDKGECKDMTVKCVQAHHKNIAPHVNPETVEESFLIELPELGFNIAGTIDLTEKGGIVADNKTSKRKYSEDAIFRSPQATMYDYAYESLRGVKPKGFRYDVMIKRANGAETQQIAGEVTYEDRIWLFDRLKVMNQNVRAGNFLTAPDDVWWCSPDWCGYWNQCKGKCHARKS